MTVYGLDLSLTATGIAALSIDVMTLTPSWQAFTVKSTGHDDDPWHVVHDRIVRLTGLITEPILDTRPDLVVMEGPAPAAKGGHQHDRSGLWWRIYAVVSEVAPLAIVKPNSRAKYATGKGNAGKDEVLLAVSRRYPEAPIRNNNEADAVALAAMGARWLGWPIDTPLPARHIEAMDASEWPALLVKS